MSRAGVGRATRMVLVVVGVSAAVFISWSVLGLLTQPSLFSESFQIVFEPAGSLAMAVSAGYTDFPLIEYLVFGFLETVIVVAVIVGLYSGLRVLLRRRGNERVA